MAIKGKFADGSDLLAIPNYARTNRDGAATAGPQGAGRDGEQGPEFDCLDQRRVVGLG